jgi:hypothetical protein
MSQETSSHGLPQDGHELIPPAEAGIIRVLRVSPTGPVPVNNALTNPVPRSPRPDLYAQFKEALDAEPEKAGSAITVMGKPVSKHTKNKMTAVAADILENQFSIYEFVRLCTEHPVNFEDYLRTLISIRDDSTQPAVTRMKAADKTLQAVLVMLRTATRDASIPTDLDLPDQQLADAAKNTVEVIGRIRDVLIRGSNDVRGETNPTRPGSNQSPVLPVDGSGTTGDRSTSGDRADTGSSPGDL